MSSRDNRTITTRAKLANAGTKVQIAPQAKVAAGKLDKDVVAKSGVTIAAKGVVIPQPSHPHPWETEGPAKLSRR